MTEAGLPPGWLNVVVGSASEIGDLLVGDERVATLTFTGSGDVGWKLKERAPRKHVALELGNATPVIVCADAPPGTPAKLAANSFSFAGQSCISVQRIYLLDDAWDGFVRDFVPEVEALHIGDPADEETDVGPVIDDDARERILSWIEESGGGIDRRRRDRGGPDQADRDREPVARREGLLRRSLRPCGDPDSLELARGGDRAGELDPLRAPGRDLHR
jgi:acyl-CoA reductase-like NAD-dependent aldehyde dehydrogenase